MLHNRSYAFIPSPIVGKEKYCHHSFVGLGVHLENCIPAFVRVCANVLLKVNHAGLLFFIEASFGYLEASPRRSISPLGNETTQFVVTAHVLVSIS